jgi:hypothetical protein
MGKNIHLQKKADTISQSDPSILAIYFSHAFTDILKPESSISVSE